jgi:MFS family permease
MAKDTSSKYVPFLFLSFLSQLGSATMPFAVAILLFERTGSASQALIGYSVTLMSSILVVFFGGSIDVQKPKPVYFGLETAQALVFLAIYLFSGWQNVYVLCLLLVITGAMGNLSEIFVNFSIVPLFAKNVRVGNLYSYHLGLTNLSHVIAPLIAGYFISIDAVEELFLLNSASFAMSAGAGFLVASQAIHIRGASPFRLVDGFLALWGMVQLRNVVFVLFLVNLGAGALVPAVIIFFASHYANASIWVSSASLLGVVVSLFAGRLVNHISPLNAVVILLGFSVVVSVFFLVEKPPVVGAGVVMLIALASGINVLTTIYRFQVIPTERRVQINAIIRAVLSISIALSALVFSVAVYFREFVPYFAQVPALLLISFFVAVRSRKSR